MRHREVFENISSRSPRAGFGLLSTRHRHFVKQDFAKLLGRSDIKLLAGEFVDFVFQPRHLLREPIRQTREHVAVNLDAVHLHLAQDWGERALQRLVNRRGAVGDE